MPSELDTSIKDKLMMRTYAQFKIDNIFVFLKQFQYFFLKDYFYYRGQADATWDLESSYDRSKKSKKDVFYSSRYFDNMGDGILFKGELSAIKYYWATDGSFLKSQHPKLETLSEMQHYGASTRLLDVTESFGVALFFAVAENIEKKDAAIWAINKDALLWSFVKKKYNCMPLEEKKGYYFFNPLAEKEVLHWMDLMFARERMNETEINEKLCNFAEDLIGNENVITPPNNLPYSTVYPGAFPVRPMTYNKRLHAQNGLFLLQQSLEYSFMENFLSTLNKTLPEFKKDVSTADTLNISEAEDDSDLLKTALVKFIIPSSEFENCKSIMKEMNINYKSLFPDKYGIIKTAEKIYFPEEK